MASKLVKPHHLQRRAVIYVRQSTPHQVLTNQESLRLQYALQGRARALSWHEADIEVIDSDLGTSGAASDHRRGFKDLVARVTLGEVGLVLSIDVTRLARNCSDWYPLLDICALRGCLIADRDGLSRSRLAEWPPSPGTEGHDLRAGAAHDPQPPHRRAAGQGRPGRARAPPAGWPRARARRGRRQGPRPRGPSPSRARLRGLPAAEERGQGHAAPEGPGPRPAAPRPPRRP